MFHLQNGSDIRGIAMENDDFPVTLTKENCYKIGVGFATYLKEKLGKEDVKIAVGYDSRLSAEMLKEELLKAFISSDVKVMDCSLATTPSMFMTTIFDGYDVDGAVMITASHLPYYYNGFKFFTKNGGFDKNDIKSILTLANDVECNGNENIRVEIEKKRVLDDYSKFMRDKIIEFSNTGSEKPLDGFKIVVNAGNGAGGFFATEVLEKLGADISASLFLEPDGTFPNHIPNPENEEAMRVTTETVKKSGADLGIIFDTDVDRAGLVSKSGLPINRNNLIALISAILLSEKEGATIVTDSVTSLGLTKFIEEKGGVHHRFKRGYKNVINEAIRLNKEGVYAPLAIETSGHSALLENFFLDDGSYLVARILGRVAICKKEGHDIESLIADLEIPLEEKEIRIKIDDENFAEYGKKVLSYFDENIETLEGFSKEKVNYEGVRVNADSKHGDGWFLIRMSLHEPIIAINFESGISGGIETIISQITPILRKFDKLILGDEIK